MVQSVKVNSISSSPRKMYDAKLSNNRAIAQMQNQLVENAGNKLNPISMQGTTTAKKLDVTV